MTWTEIRAEALARGYRYLFADGGWHPLMERHPYWPLTATGTRFAWDASGTVILDAHPCVQTQTGAWLLRKESDDEEDTGSPALAR